MEKLMPKKSVPAKGRHHNFTKLFQRKGVTVDLG